MPLDQRGSRVRGKQRVVNEVRKMHHRAQTANGGCLHCGRFAARKAEDQCHAQNLLAVLESKEEEEEEEEER